MSEEGVEIVRRGIDGFNRQDLRRVRLAAFLAVAMFMLCASRADGATVDIGSPLVGSAILGGVGSSRLTFANVDLSTGHIASPVDGTLISWRFAGNSGFSFTPRVIRPTGGITFTGSGTGAPQQGTGGISGPFPTNLPIKAGDLIGVDPQPGSQLGVLVGRTGSEYTHWTPSLADGGPGRPPDNLFAANQEVAVAGVVRYCLVPNLVGQTRAAASASLTAADCSIGTVRKPRKKPRKHGLIVSAQSPAAGTSTSDTEPVDLTFAARKRRR